MTKRSFDISKGERRATPVIVGLMGATGSGKTVSALRAATGWVQVMGGHVGVIDTESGRALQYAPPPGVTAKSPETFEFYHLPFEAPYGSQAYADAIDAIVEHGATAVVIDSASHEHGGAGGYLDVHEQELQRLAGGDASKRARVLRFAYTKPSRERKKMIDRILAVGTKAALFICFRAEEKLDWKNRGPNNEPRELGYQPTTTSKLVWEMLAMGLLKPGANGVPEWNPTGPGEKALVKCPGFARDFFDGQITEETGKRLALWARGEQKARGEEIDISGYLSMFQECNGPGQLEGLDKIIKRIYRTLSTDQQAIINNARQATLARIQGAK
jgi:hypothetical protein